MKILQVCEYLDRKFAKVESARGYFFYVTGCILATIYYGHFF